MSPPRAFPWDEAMAFAFSVMRLSPAEFWALTPRELALAMQPLLRARSAPNRSELERLLNDFPDRE